MRALKAGLCSLLVLSLMHGVAHAALTAAQSKAAMKALTHRVDEAHRRVGASAAAKASMLRQIRDARARIGEIQSVQVTDGTTTIVGASGHIALQMPEVSWNTGHLRTGTLRTAVLSVGDEVNRLKTSEHSIVSNGVVHRKITTTAFSPDGKLNLGVLREDRRDFGAAAK
jgi:hypothetical protein